MFPMAAPHKDLHHNAGAWVSSSSAMRAWAINNWTGCWSTDMMGKSFFIHLHTLVTLRHSQKQWLTSSTMFHLTFHSEWQNQIWVCFNWKRQWFVGGTQKMIFQRRALIFPALNICHTSLYTTFADMVHSVRSRHCWMPTWSIESPLFWSIQRCEVVLWNRGVPSLQQNCSVTTTFSYRCPTRRSFLPTLGHDLGMPMMTLVSIVHHGWSLEWGIWYFFCM